MELKVIHLLLILILVIILGYFGYKASEGFANTPAVNLSCVPTDASGSAIKVSGAVISSGSTTSSGPVTSSDSTTSSGSATDSSNSSVSMNNLLGLSGAPPTDNGSMAPYLPTIENVIRGEFLNHALNIPDTPVPTVASPVHPISNTQQIASLKASDANALQTIQKVVHNELLSQKGMTTGAQMAFLGEKKRKDRQTAEEEYEEEVIEEENNSPSNHQGKEFTRDCPKNTGKPDMSQYIRKDSIPCWGCRVE